MKIDEVLEKIFNMRTIDKRITDESLNQNNEKLKKIYELLGEPCKNNNLLLINMYKDYLIQDLKL